MARVVRELGHVHPDVDGSAKRLSLKRYVSHLLGRPLSEDGAAGVADYRDDLTAAALGQAVVTAETALGIQMADMLGMDAPVRRRLLKEISDVDAPLFLRCDTDHPSDGRGE